MIAFVLVAGTIITLGHYFVWRRVVRAVALPKPWRRAATGAFLGFGLVLILVLGLTRVIDRDHLFPAAMVAYTWLGFFFYLVTSLIVVDLGRLTAWFVGKIRGAAPKTPQITLANDDTSARDDSGVAERAGDGAIPLEDLSPGSDAAAPPELVSDASRRLFLTRSVVAGAVLVSGCSATLALRGAMDIETPLVPIRLAKLPRALDGFRLAVISDLHIGPVLDGSFAARVAELTKRSKPDLIVILGDVVDGTLRGLSGDVGILGALSAPAGVAFVTGNHEYYSGVEAWTGYFRGLGWRVLDNERVRIGDKGPGGASFDLAGVNDIGARRGWAMPPDLPKALAARDDQRALVLLAHQPRQIFEAAAAGVDVQLSGHTHGGQIWPFGGLARLREPYLSGLHQHSATSQIYVTRGTGFWGPPMRLFAPPEITTIVLTT